MQEYLDFVGSFSRQDVDWKLHFEEFVVFLPVHDYEVLDLCLRIYLVDCIPIEILRAEMIVTIGESALIIV